MSKKSIITFSAIHILLVLVFMIVFDYRQTGDSPIYIGVANEFASLNFIFSPELNCHAAPGYPLFLATIKFITYHNMYLIAIIQSILFLFALFYFIKNIRLKYKISNIILILFASFILISPEIIHVNGSTLTESLCATLILFICGSLVNDLRHRKDRFLFIVSITLLVLTKMEYLLLLVLIIPFIIYLKKIKFLLNLLILLSFFLTLNGVKNKQTFGVFNPASFSSGSVIYGGNNLNLNGSWHTHSNTKNYVPQFYDSVFDSINNLSAGYACIKKDSLYKVLALEAWKNNYKDQLKIIPLKAAKLWVMPGSFDLYTSQKIIIPGLQLGRLFNDDIWPWYGKYKHAVYLAIYWSYLLMSLADYA